MALAVPGRLGISGAADLLTDELEAHLLRDAARRERCERNGATNPEPFDKLRMFLLLKIDVGGFSRSGVHQTAPSFCR
jgi:hypothetical protein